MTAVATFGLGYIAVTIFMVLLFPFALRVGKAGYVDVAWSYAMGFLAIFYVVFGPVGERYRSILVMALVLFWSLRLGTHLLRRVSREEEDSRYRGLKIAWGDRFKARMFVFYLLQAVADSVLSLAFFAAILNPNPLGSLYDYLAIAIAVVAVMGEALADRQLARFKARSDSQGKTCRVGLWRYSRHPNYFFEWLYWFSFPCLAIGSDLLWLSLLGPVVMLYLLLKVTGIPPTERQSLLKRGDDYRAYQKETSAFFPWFPKANDYGEVKQ